MGKDFDINEFRNIKSNVKKHYQDQKTGEQNLFQETSKLFKPITESSKESTKQLLTNQQQLLTNQQQLTDQVNNQNQRIEQVTTLQSLPYYGDPQIEDVPQSTPKKDYIEVDLDKGLNETDKENLQDMSLDLPSEV